MDAFWQVILSNSIVACALASVAVVAVWMRVKPAVVHLLILMALVKLFTPPVLPIGVPLPAASDLLPYEIAVKDTSPGVPVATESEHESYLLYDHHAESPAVVLGIFGSSSKGLVAAPTWQGILLLLWMMGGIVVLGSHGMRIGVMYRLLRHARRAPEFIDEMARRHARRLGLARCPVVLTLPIRITPAVWSLFGRPSIVFPAELVRQMDRDRLETLLAHELAHVKRRDHLVRYLELVAAIVFWWHPVVWWARKQLREMEERACDALVLRAVAHGERTYATALVETLEFLNCQPRPLPIVATAVSPVVSLQRRIEMMKHGFHRTATRCAILFAAAICLPAMALALTSEPPAGEATARPEVGKALHQDADQDATSDRRLVRMPSADDNGSIRIVTRDGEGRVRIRVLEGSETEPRMALLDDQDPGQRRMGIRLSEGDDERILFLGDPEDGRFRVIIRGVGDQQGEPRLMLLGEPGQDSEERVIIRRREDGDAEGRVLMLGDPEGGERVRVIIRGGEGEEGAREILFLGNRQGEEGAPKILFLGNRQGDENARIIIRDADAGEGGRVLIPSERSGDGPRRMIIRDNASDG